MIIVENSQIKDKSKFYKRLFIKFTMSRMWNSLQGKSEYGSDMSEKGYQEIALSMGESIAKDLDLNVDLAKSLIMAKGAYFPSYGKAGKNYIMELMKKNGINMSEGELAKNYVLYDLDTSGAVISREFDDDLTEMFNGNNLHTPEVKLANLCFSTMQDIKRIQAATNIDQTNLIYTLITDTEQECHNTGDIVRSKKLDTLIATLPQEEKKELSEDKKKLIDSAFNAFVKYKGTPKEAIYDSIAMDQNFYERN